MNQIFRVSGINYGEAVEWLDGELSKTKATEEERLTAQLLFEECFTRMEESCADAETFSAELRVRRRWGDVSFRLSAKGEAFNPLKAMKKPQEDEEEEDFGLVILLSHKNNVSYARENGENIISVKVHEAGGKQTGKVFAALALGIVCGLLMKTCLNEALARWIDHMFFHAAQEMFMSALMMMVAPMVFFAVLSGITGISDTADVGRLGGKLVGVSLLKLLVTSVIGISAGALLFPNASPDLLSAIAEGGAPPDFSLRDMLVGIIPRSLLKPFVDGGILQVLFLACFLGVLINRAGDRAMMAKEAIEFLNRLCMDMMGVIVQFIPLLVFVSMADLMLSTGLDALLPLGMILVGDAVGVALVFIACAAFAAAFGGASPVSFFKELVGFAPVPFAINSSNACLPQTIDFCEGKFGVNRKLAMFTLPVGIQFNMNSTGFYIAIVTVLMARTCGIALDAETLLSLFISLFIVSFTLPGCPGSALIGLSSVFAAVGVPMGAVTVFLCIDPIASMINTVGNVASNIASTLIAGKPQGESRS